MGGALPIELWRHIISGFACRTQNRCTQNFRGWMPRYCVFRLPSQRKHSRQDSNLQHAVLETAALPLLSYRSIKRRPWTRTTREYFTRDMHHTALRRPYSIEKAPGLRPWGWIDAHPAGKWINQLRISDSAVNGTQGKKKENAKGLKGGISRWVIGPCVRLLRVQLPALWGEITESNRAEREASNLPLTPKAAHLWVEPFRNLAHRSSPRNVGGGKTCTYGQHRKSRKRFGDCVEAPRSKR